MPLLEITFTKPAFPVSNVVVCPFENKRGLVLGYNLVAQGALPNQQQILGRFDAWIDRDYIDGQVAALKSEFKIDTPKPELELH